MTIKAAAEQTSGVNAAMAYGTDGPVAALGLQTPADPKGVQPIYAPAPIVREAALKAHANLPELLKPVFASLDGPTLQNSTRRSPWKARRQTGGGRLPERERVC